jgi:hypothetical protein
VWLLLRNPDIDVSRINASTTLKRAIGSVARAPIRSSLSKSVISPCFISRLYFTINTMTRGCNPVLGAPCNVEDIAMLFLFTAEPRPLGMPGKGPV